MDIDLNTAIQRILKENNLPAYKPFVNALTDSLTNISEGFVQKLNDEAINVVREIKRQIKNRSYKAKGFVYSVEQHLRDSGLPADEAAAYRNNYECSVILIDKKTGEAIEDDQYAFDSYDGPPYNTLRSARSILREILDGINEYGMSPKDMGFKGDPDVSGR